MPVPLGPMTPIYQQTSLWWTGGNVGGHHMSKDIMYMPLLEECASQTPVSCPEKI